MRFGELTVFVDVAFITGLVRETARPTDAPTDAAHAFNEVEVAVRRFCFGQGEAAVIKAIDEDYDVVMWEKHGVFAVDTDIMSAFDQVDVLNKSALIYIAARNMGFEPEGMTDGQMKELSSVFGLPK